jgi:hypothetical protein
MIEKILFGAFATFLTLLFQKWQAIKMNKHSITLK